MQLIQTNGTVLSSLEMGAQGFTPVLMIHGLMFGNMATWYSSMAAPMAKQHHVVLYDQRGHGDSPVTATGYDLDTQLADLRSVLAHYGLDRRPIDVVGHSMGAVLALNMALSSPDRVRRLVLVDAPLPVGEHVLPDLLNVHSPEVLAGYIDANQNASGGRRRERMHRRLEQLFFHSTLVRDLTDYPTPSDSELSRLRVSTLLVYGRHSHCVASGAKLESLLPAARLELLDCGHYVVEDQPDALRQLVISFLEDRE